MVSRTDSKNIWQCIIYHPSCQRCPKRAGLLDTQGTNAKDYHCILPNEERLTLEDQLLNNEGTALDGTLLKEWALTKLKQILTFIINALVVSGISKLMAAERGEAYGIMLSGEKDNDITNYFIETAFPPEAHTQQVLDVLNQASNGLSVPQIEKQLNLAKGKIDKVLKLLSLEFPAPVTKQGSKWYTTPINYQHK